MDLVKLAITGAGGFLGWHTQLLAFSRGTEDISALKLGEGFDLGVAVEAVDGSNRLVHIAGINRAPADEIEQGNRLFAEQLAMVIRETATPPRTVVYANSIQAEHNNPYGRGKRLAGEILADTCMNLGIQFIDLKLPNIFGEEGHPDYNSVVSTFAHRVVRDQRLQVDNDNELPLMHAQEAARLLLEADDSADLEHAVVRRARVSAIATAFEEIHELYRHGEIPDISEPLTRDLFNVYRAAYFGHQTSIPLEPKSDNRGYLVETVKSHGGEGQTFFSTTKPGITRGDHFHLRKVERFVVLSGRAEICLRKMFTDQTIKIEVSGLSPSAVDMPIGWVHNITNIGDSDLFTQFWTNEIFDPSDTDTFFQKV